jgi:hypothetical protein
MGRPREDRFVHVEAALRSFSANGFSTLSVNRQDEIARLHELFPEVHFVVDDPKDGIFPGRYGPSFGSIFGALGRPAACAIVNADNYMLKGEIVRRMSENPHTTFVARRLDVDVAGATTAGVYERGIDGLFLSSDHCESLANDKVLTKLQLGAPFWDIVLPIAASLHGTVKFIAPPFLLHPLHEANWSHADYDRLRLFSIGALADHAKRYSKLSPRAALFDRLMSEFVYARGPKLSHSSLRNAMSIFDLWLKNIETHNTVSLSTSEVLGENGEMRFCHAPAVQNSEGGDAASDVRGFLRRWKMRRRERKNSEIRRLIDSLNQPESFAQL